MPTSARCDDLEALKKKGCHPDDIENPRGSKDIKKNKNVTNRSKGTAEKLQPEDITQIQPQQLVLQLRSGTGPAVCPLKRRPHRRPAVSLTLANFTEFSENTQLVKCMFLE